MSGAALAGADVVTLTVSIIDRLLAVPQTDAYTNRFVETFRAYAGLGKTLLDFE